MKQKDFPPLDRFTIKPASDGLVAVTVHLPPDLVRDYCRFLESLADFFHTVDRKAKIERAHVDTATRAAQVEEGKQRLAEYDARLSTSYDAYLASGLDRKNATKSVASDLRRDNHPWSTFDLVRSRLVKLGRGGRAGRPRRAQSQDP